MASPLITNEILSFQAIGIDPVYATLSNTALSKDRFLCVREVTEAESYVAIVDLQNRNNVTRHRMVADAAIMHPSRDIIALRGSNLLQVFDLQARKRLNTYTLPEGQIVNYWRWTDEDTLSFVAGANVFRWSLSGNTTPAVVCPLLQPLSQGAIMNYIVSDDLNWHAIFGIVRENEQSVGKVQLYSREKNASHVIDAYTCAFALAGNLLVMVYATKAPGQLRIMITPLQSTQQAQQFGRRQLDLPLAPDAADDIPLHTVYSPKYSSIFALTKTGYLYVFEVETPFLYLTGKVSASPFIHASLAAEGSVIALTRDGKMTKFLINDGNIVDFISVRRGNPQVAARIASTAGLQVSGEFLSGQFDQLLMTGNIQEAARIAISQPSIRTNASIRKIQSLPAGNGPNPFLQYISFVMEQDKLNEVESTEICKLVLSQGKNKLIEKWIQEEKLTITEELGDICKPYDGRIALAIYLRLSASPKVCASLAEADAFDKLQAYCQKVNYQPNWMQVLTLTVRTNPEACTPTLTFIASGGHPIVDPRQVVQLLLQFQLVKQAVAFLIDVLIDNKEEDSELQTTLFEIALLNAPQIAEELFERECFTYYDRIKVAGLCERANNFQRALEHYVDLPSIKRCIVNTQFISTDFLVKYFGSMSTEWALECLGELLTSNPKQNVQIVVAVTGTYYNQFGIDAILNLFNRTHCSDGIYFFLAQIVTTCEDPDIHFRYLEAAAKKQDYQEVERMCHDSQHIQPERVRDFLMQVDLPDRVPLIVLCDRFNFVEELVKFLYKKNSNRDIETYVQKFNPNNAGKVIGALLDIEAPQDYIQRLILSVEHTAPIDELIKETMKRERLKVLQPLLERRAQAGAIDPATNNGIVLLAVVSNRNPESTLKSNQYYDPKFVGDILAKRDAHLAYIAYARGNCDAEVLQLTNNYQLYKEQARYCVDRQSPELWAQVLSPENEHMKLVVDAVISTALPECQDPDKVSQTVKSFIDAQIPNQLIGLLEKVVLESPQFQNNGSLQNLLIITAIRSDTKRVMNYITRLNDYSYEKICEHLLREQLYDEAIAAYKKFNQNVEAVKVMIEYKHDITAAADWATHCNDPHVWSEVARAQLAEGLIADSISSFIKARDTKEYSAVIEVAKQQGEYKALVPFLKLARELQNRDSLIDSELCFAYAKVDMLGELEELVSAPNGAKVGDIGQRCFDEQLFKAAKILFTAINDYVRLTETLIELKDLRGAIDAARKAQNVRSWKAVNKACVELQDFKLAQTAGLYVVVEADELDGIIKLYESYGYFEPVVQLLEAALPLERAHIGIFTELSVLYAKYQPDKTLDHLRHYYSKMNLFKVIQILKKLHMWNELTYAYEKYNEFDNAVLTMIEHPSAAWTHAYFKEMIVNISNADILMRSLEFYVSYSPLEINDLLLIVGPKVDTTKVVNQFERFNQLQLIKTYLTTVQGGNIQAVNEALNNMYVEDGDYETLRLSIDRYNLFDHISFAKKLRSHECLEFRRISSYLYRKKERWSESIEISKKDHFYRDAIETAAQSKSVELVEELVRFFIAENLVDCFAALTYVCYDFVTSDLILELSWRNNCNDYAMPYLIQSTKEQNGIIQKLTTELEEVKTALEQTKEVAQTAQIAASQPSFQSQAGFAQVDPFSAPAGGGGSQSGFVSASYSPQAVYSGSQGGDPFGGQTNFVGAPASHDPFANASQFPAFPPTSF